MKKKDSCPFCSPDIDNRVIYQDNWSIIILSKEAINAGQALVIPKRHIVTINDASRDEIHSMHYLAKRVADAYVRTFYYDGVNILINSGIAAGQTIDHLHAHVVPRKLGDVKAARDWLSTEFKEKEYIPNCSEIDYYTNKLIDCLARS